MNTIPWVVLPFWTILMSGASLVRSGHDLKILKWILVIGSTYFLGISLVVLFEVPQLTAVYYCILYLLVLIGLKLLTKR
jgi:hypothetical protein